MLMEEQEMAETTKKKVLFVCTHNSARSQMAEAFLNKYGENRFEAESAGLKAGILNPLVVTVMKEIGIDIAGNRTKNVLDFYKQGKRYHYVITVCDESAAQTCPIFPGILTKTIHWDFKDPSSFQGTWEEKLAKTREVRDLMEQKINEWITSIN